MLIGNFCVIEIILALRNIFDYQGIKSKWLMSFFVLERIWDHSDNIQ